MKKSRHLFRTCMFLQACALGGLWLINRKVSESALEKNILKPETGHFYDWKQNRVFYHVLGNGQKPLLLIHNADPYSCGAEWSRVQNGLLKDYTLYVIDLPGCGRSDKPAMTYTNYYYVQLITDFIKDVIGEKTAVAATGISASFALMASLKEESLLSGLVMIDPYSPKKLAQVPGTRSRAVKLMLSLPVIGEAVYNILTSRQNTEYVMEEKWFFNPFRLSQKMIHTGYEAAHSGDGSGRFLLASLDGHFLNWNVNRAVSICPIPVSIIYGEKAATGQQSATAYTKIDPDIKLYSVADAGSVPQLENPNLFLSAFSQAMSRA